MDPTNVDVDTIEKVCILLKTYGGWGVSAILFCYLFWETIAHRRERNKLIKEHKAERNTNEERRLNERKIINDTFEEHRKENVKLVETMTIRSASEASRLKALETVIIRLLDYITKGKIIIEKQEDASDETMFFYNDKEN